MRRLLPRHTRILTAVAVLALGAGAASTEVSAQQRGPMDREFLRMMSDHHEGLVQMGRQAAGRAQDAQVKAMAQRLADDQAREQREILQMLRQHFGETHQPMVMPENRVQMEQLARYQGTEYDREFMELTIHHHNDGIMMIHLMRPGFQRQDVRAKANEMEEKQMREVREIKQMLGWPTEMMDRMIQMIPMGRGQGMSMRSGVSVQKDG